MLTVITDDPAAVDRVFWGKEFQEDLAWTESNDSPEADRWWNLLCDAQGRYTLRVPSMENPSLDCGLVIIRDSQRSQFDLVVEAMRNGVPLPRQAACLALTGKKFHGQKSRHWTVMEGNLHLTILLSPSIPISKVRHGFSVLPTLATVRAIRECMGSLNGLGIKWVNDIMVHDRKIGGVITETLLQGDCVERVVLGIGLNVNHSPELTRERLIQRTGCLADSSSPQIPIPLWQLAVCILKELNQVQTILCGDDGWTKLLEEYNQNLIGRGQMVTVFEAEPDQTGHFPVCATGKLISVNSDLSLTLGGISDPILKGRLIMDDFEVE